MTLEEHYREHGTLNAHQIEYLLAVHNVVKRIDTRGWTMQKLHRSETPLFRAMQALQVRLDELTAAVADRLPNEVQAQLGTAAAEFRTVAHMVDEAARHVEEDCQYFLHALPAAMA